MNVGGNIYGNRMSAGARRRALRRYRLVRRRFVRGSDPISGFAVHTSDSAPVGIRLIVPGDQQELSLSEQDLVIGTIRMGYGHYRMGLAIASCARALGYQPLWLDYLSFPGSATGNTIAGLEKLYSLGSRLSQSSRFFNRRIWEPITSRAALKLSYTLRDQAMGGVFAEVCEGLPDSVPYVATHPWTAHAAVAAGQKAVVNIIPDNFPLAFHVAPGAVHAVQTPSSYLGYRTFRDMGEGNSIPSPMPDEAIFLSGHYVDHELVSNIDVDCDLRERRVRDKRPKRVLISMGGAGAQLDRFQKILEMLFVGMNEGRVCVFLNLGDHQNRMAEMQPWLQQQGFPTTVHNDWTETRAFAEEAYRGNPSGLHVFISDDPFAAVYTTNILMRPSDIMITKPSELSFYPIPKLFIQRVGRHEAWGALRGAEIGDGTLESASIESARATLQLMLSDNDLLPQYCASIRRNRSAGIYDGGYEVVRNAVRMSESARVSSSQ